MALLPPPNPPNPPAVETDCPNLNELRLPTGDPKFTDRAGADYALLTGSPCINCGDNLGVPVDYLHKPRPFNVLPDRGGYERQSI